jgi:hypothetical protein
MMGKIMSMKFRASVIVLPLLLVACAKAPERIAAVPMPDEPYRSMQCSQLEGERYRSGLTLSTLTKAQTNASTGDAIGVILIGVPTSSLTGYDRETELAVEKGRMAAIERAIAAQGCTAAAPKS